MKPAINSTSNSMVPLLKLTLLAVTVSPPSVISMEGTPLWSANFNVVVFFAVQFSGFIAMLVTVTSVFAVFFCAMICAHADIINKSNSDCFTIRFAFHFKPHENQVFLAVQTLAKSFPNLKWRNGYAKG